MGLGAAHHALPPPIADQTFGDLRAGLVEIIEGAARDFEVELSAVGGQRGAELIEDLDWQAAGVRVLLHQHRWYRIDEDRLSDASLGVTRNISRHFSAA